MTLKQESPSTHNKRKIAWIITSFGGFVLLAGYFAYSKVLASSQNVSSSQAETTIVHPGDLTRQDMFSTMQTQGQTVGATQNNGTSQTGSTSTNRGDNSGTSDAIFMGPPPEGGFGGGNPNYQAQRSQSGSSTNTNNSSQPAVADPNRIPTPLIQAVIEYLKAKAGA